MKRAIFSGSFDPITRGHMDIIERGAQLFDELVVAVLHNPDKQGCFSPEKRVEFIKKCIKGLNNINVCTYDGFVVDYLKENKIDVILRGMRSEFDFYAEQQYMLFNSALYPKAETVFLLTRPEYMHISSSGVRQVLQFGGDISAFVPPAVSDSVAEEYKRLYGKGNEG